MSPEQTLEQINKVTPLVEGYIRQFNEGLVTSHEMANSILNAVYPISANFPEIGCDGILSEPHNRP